MKSKHIFVGLALAVGGALVHSAILVIAGAASIIIATTYD